MIPSQEKENWARILGVSEKEIDQLIKEGTLEERDGKLVYVLDDSHAENLRQALSVETPSKTPAAA